MTTYMSSGDVMLISLLIVLIVMIVCLGTIGMLKWIADHWYTRTNDKNK